MLVQQIARTTRMDEKEVQRIADRASTLYKVYEIPKRQGGKRKIAHPSRELKALQRWITKVIVQRLPVHDAATAYRKGSGIKENAERHRTSKFTNRYDFANFFPSFAQADVQEFLQAESKKVGIVLDSDDIKFVGDIVCRFGKLTIGAPSSPAITNAMMFTFDQMMFEYCDQKGLVYTRYADDIFISANEPNMLRNLEARIAEFKRKVPHLNIRLNRQKTAHLSKKYRRSITGVVITPQHTLSIGRSRKREIKSLVHRWVVGKLDVTEIAYLRGMVAFARDIEPDFESALRSKYGNAAINEILKHPNLREFPDTDYSPIQW